MTLERAKNTNFEEFHGMNLIQLLSLICGQLASLDQISEAVECYRELAEESSQEEYAFKALLLESIVKIWKKFGTIHHNGNAFRSTVFRELPQHLEEYP